MVINITIPKAVEDCKLIPLKPFSKEASVKWGTDSELPFTGKETSYAIDTGRSNLVVVDCDISDSANGLENFLDLVSANDAEIPETLTVQTANGGLHYYFVNSNKNDKIKSSISALAPGVDIRALGGYVVGPGSIVNNKNGDPAEYVIDDDEIEIAHLPEWLKDKLVSIANIKSKSRKEDKKESLDTIEREKTPKKNSLSRIDQKNIFYWAAIKMGEALEGERNSILNSTSFFMGRARIDKIIAEEIVNIAITTGLDSIEAKRTFERSYADGFKEAELDFEQISTEYDKEMKVDFKYDPLNSAYYSHVGLSYHFYDRYPNDYVFWTKNESWYRYIESRGCWEMISEQELAANVESFLDDLVISLREKMKQIPSNIYKLHERLWVKSFIKDVTEICRNRYINRNSNLFDSNTELLNVKNGVINLKTSEFSDHTRENYLTHYVPIEYHQDATDKYCDKVIESIAPTEREFMQVMLGQALTGEQPRSQVALFLHGRGSNGKSTLLDLILKTSGDYGKLQPPGVLVSDKNGGDKYALADFNGLRTAVIEELPNSKVLDVGAIKRIVGTQKINARAIYGSNKEFSNECTLFVSCNRLPLINETDYGTWRRVLVISFPYTYKKRDSDIKGEFDRKGDPMVIHSAQRSRKTAEAFLAWRVEGAIKWYADTNIESNVPESIVETVNEWNENNDMLLSWFNQSIQCDATTALNYITIEDLWRSYNDFLINRGNAQISLRFFVEQFFNHSVFYDNKITRKSQSRILVSLERSVFYPSNDPMYVPKKDPQRAAHIIGAAFKGIE